VSVITKRQTYGPEATPITDPPTFTVFVFQIRHGFYRYPVQNQPHLMPGPIRGSPASARAGVSKKQACADAGSFSDFPALNLLAIEKTYANYFQHWHSTNHVSTVDRVIAVGIDVRAFGTWSSAFQDTNGAPRKDRGHYRWLLVSKGDTWEIRTNTNRSSDFNATN
jgi:hypothetical protein